MYIETLAFFPPKNLKTREVAGKGDSVWSASATRATVACSPTKFRLGKTRVSSFFSTFGRKGRAGRHRRHSSRDSSPNTSLKIQRGILNGPTPTDSLARREGVGVHLSRHDSINSRFLLCSYLESHGSSPMIWTIDRVPTHTRARISRALCQHTLGRT